MSETDFETGDRVTETRLAEYMLHEILADYVKSGAGITTDFPNDQITVASGAAYLDDSGSLYYAQPDETTLTLPAPSGDNLVFVAYDPSTDDSATYEIDTDAGNVADPKLQIATVDGAGETVTEENRNPDATLGEVVLAGAMDAGGNDITNVAELAATLVDATTVEGDTLEAVNTFTDASGTDHTGELADETSLETKADLTSAGGVLVSSQLPQLSITSVDVVADQTERLNLDAEEGDFAIQQDNDTSYILSTNDPTVDSNWVEIDFDAVAAIAGQAIAPASVDASGEVSASTTDTDTLEFLDANETTPSQTAVSGTVNIDLEASNWHDPIEADGDITINFQNVSGEGNSVLLYLEDTDGTGPHSVSWPAGTVWRGGDVADEIPADGNLEVQLRTADGGTEWRGTYAEGFE